MKKLNFYLWATLIAGVFVFSSCEKENEEQTITVNFEDVTLNSEGFWNGSDLSGVPQTEESYGIEITQYYGSFKSNSVSFLNQYVEDWTSWSGFACSNWKDKTNAQITENQYSVYADGGANGSEKFAVSNGISNFKFAEGVTKTIQNVMVNNTTCAYFSIKNGDLFAKKFEAGDWFKLTFTGFDAQENKTGTTEFYLADFRNGKTYICTDWTKVELSSLGKVNKVEISLSSSDNSDFGMNTPAYVCLDNLVYVK